VLNSAMFEQAYVAGQNNPVLLPGKMHNLMIFVFIIIESVEPTKAKVSGKLAQVYIEDEPGLS